MESGLDQGEISGFWSCGDGGGDDDDGDGDAQMSVLCSRRWEEG